MGTAIASAAGQPVTEPKCRRLGFFERYLTVWVLLCMVIGVAFGKVLPDLTAALSRLEFGQGSHVNVPIGVLLWLMIYPMMLKVDFSSIGGIARKPKGSWSPCSSIGSSNRSAWLFWHGCLCSTCSRRGSSRTWREVTRQD